MAFAKSSFLNGCSTRGFGWHIVFQITIIRKVVQKHLECFGISVVCCHPEKTGRAVEDGVFEFRAEIGLGRNVSVLEYEKKTLNI